MESFHIKSKNTDFYVVSTKQDKVGQEINTKNGKNSTPDNSVLTVTPAIRGPVTIASITGISGLYVALKGSAEKTKLTWSDKKYTWVIRETHANSSTYYVNPADGADLYWFDEFKVGVGDHVTVMAGKNIKPPQAEWFFTKA